MTIKNINLLRNIFCKTIQQIIQYLYVNLDFCYNSINKWNRKAKPEME